MSYIGETIARTVDMNLPNKLTVFRICTIPFLVLFLVIEEGRPYTWMAALAIFIIATASDIADGRIARKYNLITDFGKLMDPLADKMMTCCAYICFIELDILPSWFVIVIVFREFMISGFRLIAAENGSVIAASWWGKKKSTFQMTMIISILVLMCSDLNLVWDTYYISVTGGIPDWLETFWTIYINITTWGSLILTVVSLIDYMKNNWSVMGNQF